MDAWPTWRSVFFRANTTGLEKLEKLVVQARDPHQPLHFLGDSAFTSSSMLHRMPPEIAVTGRIGFNSRIHAPAPPRKEGRGRPRIRGERTPIAAWRSVGVAIYRSLHLRSKQAA